MFIFYIVILSIIFQLAAAFMALRLIKITGDRLSWAAIAAAMGLQVARRTITLIDLITGRVVASQVATSELIGLALSILMAVGVGTIGPFFSAIAKSIAERKQAEERVRHINSVLSALRGVNQLITREKDRERLTQRSCDILVDNRGYERAWILLVDENRSPISIAAAGLGEESTTFLEQMRQGKYPECVRELWTRESAFLDYDSPGVQHKGCIEAGIHSIRGVYRCRLEYEGKIYGMLGVTVSSGMVSDAEEQDLFLELCGDISFALASIERQEKREQAEEALKSSEEKLRIMFDSVPEGITISDLNGNITESNEAAVRMHGYGGKEELIGKSAFVLIAEEDHSRAAENLKNTLEKGRSSIVEYTFTKRDGSEFPAELSAALLKDGVGNPAGFIAVTRDITERKNMEEQLIITDRLASVGELASGIAHELNNPLTGVIGLSQLLIERDVPVDIKEDLKLVYSEAQRAAQVVKNLLTFARKHPVSKEPVSVNEAIEKVLALRAYEQKISNIQVKAHLAPDLPKILGDYFQLQQVFLNIIINGEYFMIQAHGKGTLTIITKREGNTIRVSFADDGPGISKENLRHLFTPFFTTKEVGKGTGLGLSICHGIISTHNGKIYAESGLGKGATFIVELPLTDEEK